VHPILFSIMMNTLAQEIKRRCRHGVQLVSNTPHISILLFADDITLVADTVMGLQNQLNIMKLAADRLELSVNVDKSKITIVRNGGHIVDGEMWFIGDNELVVASEYKYLGKTFSTRLSTTVALNNLACRAKAAVSQITRAMRRLEYTTPEVFFTIIDAQVQPMLLYAAEV